MTMIMSYVTLLRYMMYAHLIFLFKIFSSKFGFIMIIMIIIIIIVKKTG